MKNIPKIGLGTYKGQGSDLYGAIINALNIGYEHIDTAQIYGNEDIVGQAMVDSGIIRDKIWLTTKVWIDKYSKNDCLLSVQESLKKLKTEYVDLLLMHWPNKENDYSIHHETLDAFMELKRSGVVKNIGVSNFNLKLLDDAWNYTGGQIYTNQIEYHVNLDQTKLLDYCKKHGIILTAYAPLTHGHLENNTILNDIAKKHNKTISQIALRYLIRQGEVVAIPKAISIKHLKENIDIFDFDLDDEDISDILSLPKNYRYFDFPGLSPDWD